MDMICVVLMDLQYYPVIPKDSQLASSCQIFGESRYRIAAASARLAFK